MNTLERTYDLPSFAELRIRTGNRGTVRVVLVPSLSGTVQRAEVAGSELTPGIPVTLPPLVSLAVFTCTGCTVMISAPPATLQDCYATTEGAVWMRSLTDIHSHLEVFRQQAKKGDGLGPRVLFVSDRHCCGTSTYVKYLSQFTVRIGYHPLLLDAALENCAFGYSGCLSLYELQYPIDVEEGLNFHPGVHFFMSSRRRDPHLFATELETIAAVGNEKMGRNIKSRVGGIFVDYGCIDPFSVCETAGKTKENPIDTLLHTITALDIDQVFVVQSAWLRFKIAQRAQEGFGASPGLDEWAAPFDVRGNNFSFKMFLVDGIAVGPSPYSGDALQRRTWLTYFFGSEMSPLQPERVVLDVLYGRQDSSDGSPGVRVVTIGSADQESIATLMPMALHDGERDAPARELCTVLSKSPLDLTKGRLLAISTATEFEPLPDGTLQKRPSNQFDEAILRATIRGFAVVESVTAEKLTVLVGNGNIHKELGVCFFLMADSFSVE